MMPFVSTWKTGLFIFFLMAFGCSSGDQPETLGKQTPMELSSGWARPGLQGKSGAAYITITNPTATPDTLEVLDSPAAGRTEIHRSFEGEEGLIEMRPAGKQPVSRGQTLHLEPGGIHVMLMDLTKDLAPGDSISLTFTFSNAGRTSVDLPVQTQAP